MQCHVCGLSLVASPHLARSYHHLFPVKPFSEVPAEEVAASQVCEPTLVWPYAPAVWRCCRD